MEPEKPRYTGWAEQVAPPCIDARASPDAGPAHDAADISYENFEISFFASILLYLGI